jgi:two-component system chemotaxis sensor kinase CheA
MQDREIVQEFLVESAENLDRLDREMVELERQPRNTELLGSIFRTIHTVKGTCGFLGFDRLGALAHAAENILSDLRSERTVLDANLTSLILDSVDAIKRMLSAIESAEDEGPVFETGLLERLHNALNGPTDPAAVEPQAVEPPKAEPVDHEDPGAIHKETSLSESSLRVDVNLLDRLMNLVGELVLTRNQVLQYNAGRDDGALNAISQRLNLITTELQGSVMKTRMQPIQVIWNKLPRLVRDLANTLGKEIALDLEGSETELDRTVIEAIKDPLTHMVRNSCDHGIETPAERVRRGKPARGSLSLRAYHEGGQVNIEITDDGAGMDPARLRAKALERGLITPARADELSDRAALSLVFLPGFSTAAAVTSISGRGVGMDVLRTNIERIGGAVDLSSKPGFGTTVHVRIPLTLAIIPGLLVEAGGERFVIPQLNLHELIRLEGDALNTRIEYVHSTPVYRSREALLPLIDLSDVLKLRSRRSPEEVSIAVVQAENRRFGLVVDTICDTQEIVVKPMGHQLRKLNCYAGATIMGDGRVALILDIPGIAQRSGILTAGEGSAREASATEAVSAQQEERHSLLLFRAGAFPRLALPLARVARLEKIPRSRIEATAGGEVVQYRGTVLPLLPLAQLLGGGGGTDADLLQVVVVGSGDAIAGLVVDEIVDIVEERATCLRASDLPGLLGSGVVGGKVTAFVDLDAVASRALGFSSEVSLARLREALLGSVPVEVTV